MPFQQVGAKGKFLHLPSSWVIDFFPTITTFEKKMIHLALVFHGELQWIGFSLLLLYLYYSWKIQNSELA